MLSLYNIAIVFWCYVQLWKTSELHYYLSDMLWMESISKVVSCSRERNKILLSGRWFNGINCILNCCCILCNARYRSEEKLHFATRSNLYKIWFLNQMSKRRCRILGQKTTLSSTVREIFIFFQCDHIHLAKTIELTRSKTKVRRRCQHIYG